MSTAEGRVVKRGPTPHAGTPTATSGHGGISLAWEVLDGEQAGVYKRSFTLRDCWAW